MKVNSLAWKALLLTAAASIPVVAQNNGYVKTTVNPTRAGVFIDGKYVGPAGNFGASRKYAVAPGEHEIRLAEPRYEEMTTKVTVQAGKTTTLSETMKALPLAKPPFGRLRTIDPPDKFTAVYVNGHFMGHAGEFNNSVQGLMLNPGTYQVKFVPVNGAETTEQQVTIEADKTTMVNVGK
jgi:hypothetical protein